MIKLQCRFWKLKTEKLKWNIKIILLSLVKQISYIAWGLGEKEEYQILTKVRTCAQRCSKHTHRHTRVSEHTTPNTHTTHTLNLPLSHIGLKKNQKKGNLGDEKSLWYMICIPKWSCVTEIYIENLYNLINQYDPNTFNFKKMAGVEGDWWG